MENDESGTLPKHKRQIPFRPLYDISERAAGDFCKRLQERLAGCDETGVHVALSLENAESRGLSYSCRNGAYRSFPASQRGEARVLARGTVPRAFAHLEDLGLIEHTKQAPGLQSIGMQSYAYPTADFMQLMEEVKEGRRLLPRMPDEMILLRDKNHMPMQLPDDPEIHRMERALYWHNKDILSADIRDEDGRALAFGMTRIFNENLGRGGRAYAAGLSWQGIKNKEERLGARGLITIDAQPTAEADFKYMHPFALYSRIGVNPPQDIYDIGEAWPRRLAKTGTLILINASSMAKTIGSLHRHEDMRLIEHFGASVIPGSDVAKAKARELIKAIKHKHAPIKQFFHSNIGAELMRLDSDIMASIMEKTQRQGFIALPAHDSAIVQLRHIEQLEEAMFEAAESFGLRHIGIERKSYDYTKRLAPFAA